ncbi:IS3 family transposase [Collinsella tanakaei]|uniref:IS3 family transposase n=1 Tax=Collinsella tanakaei TaxID=626935 RepID=UPI001D7F6290|nr:IS3 family transposase [Collinsella tanakaei]
MDSPEGGGALPRRDKALAVAELSGQGHDLADLLEAAGLARSTYYCALAHPKGPTRPELRARVAEIFGRLPNGVGHRQVAMELRAVDGARIADKTVLKMMGEMGLRCGIRKETDYHRYNSYKGVVGETFENVLGRDFEADGPWQKMGTDVTEFRLSFGKAYLAPVYDFGSKEIVAHSVSEHPDLAQQEEMLDMLEAAMPEGASPVMQMDMGWQYQHAAFAGRLRRTGIVQSMSRKGNCIDNGATEQVFGHIKDEFFRGRDWDDFESFKRDLEAYIDHWNRVRRQVKLKGLTPAEFREQALRKAA